MKTCDETDAREEKTSPIDEPALLVTINRGGITKNEETCSYDTTLNVTIVMKRPCSSLKPVVKRVPGNVLRPLQIQVDLNEVKLPENAGARKEIEAALEETYSAIDRVVRVCLGL